MSHALVKVVPLHAEAALKTAVSGFEAILTDEQKTAFRTTALPQPSDVFSLAVEIEKQSENRKSRRFVGSRLINVLEAVQRFSTLIDAAVGGSQSLVAGSIWGSVKLALQVSRVYESPQGQLLTTNV